MKKIYFLVLASVSLFMASCDKANDYEESQPVKQEQAIPENDLKVFQQMGYETRSIQAVEGGYLIDNSTMMTTEQLDAERANYLWFEIVYDIPDMVYVDLTKTYHITCKFPAGEEPNWNTTKVGANICITSTEYNTRCAVMTYLGKGVFSYRIPRRGMLTATVTIDDGIHKPTTLEKSFLIKSPKVYYKSRHAIEGDMEVAYIDFYSNPECTSRMTSPYSEECTFSLWVNRYGYDGVFVDGKKYGTQTVQIPYGVSSYKLFEYFHVGILSSDTFKKEAVIEGMEFLN